MNLSTDFIDYLYKFFIENKNDLCAYCTHRIDCLGTDCDCYEVFGKATSIIIDGVTRPYNGTRNLTCMDLDFGTCPKLENTPCNTCCTSESFQNFDWNGDIPTNYDSL